MIPQKAEEGSGGKKGLVARKYEELLETTAGLIGQERHAAAYINYFYSRWWPRLLTFWNLTKHDHGDDAMNQRFDEVKEKLAEYTTLNPLPNLGYVGNDAERVQKFYAASLEARALAEEYTNLLNSNNKIY